MNHMFIRLYLEHADLMTERLSTLINHILNAHQIWNSRLLNQSSFDRFQINPNHSLRSINEENYRKSLLIVNDDNTDLENIITYQTSTGDSFHNSIEDILLHVINHSTYHRAQVATDFKQLGIAPPISDYIAYKRTLPTR